MNQKILINDDKIERIKVLEEQRSNLCDILYVIATT